MKPYGLRVIPFPDVADIQKMGAKSSTGRLPEKGGDFKSYSRKNKKKKIRRYWKKKARNLNKKEERNADNG
jgi:hypothetical protein